VCWAVVLSVSLLCMRSCVAAYRMHRECVLACVPHHHHSLRHASLYIDRRGVCGRVCVAATCADLGRHLSLSDQHTETADRSSLRLDVASVARGNRGGWNWKKKMPR